MFILKKGHQPGVYVPLRALFLVIYINFVELGSPMLHAKFQDHWTSGSGEEDF